MEETHKASNTDEDHARRVGRIARGVGVGSLGQVIGRLTGFLTQLVLARMLGPGLLGFYVLGTTVVSIANVLSQMGMDNGVVRYVSHYRATGDDARVKGVIVQALLITFFLSVLLGAALFLGAGFLADHIFERPFLNTIFKAFSLSLPFLTVMSMALWATQGLQTVKYSIYVQQIVRPVGGLMLIGVFYLFGAEILGVVAAYILSVALGCALALRYLWKVFPKIADKRVPAVFETRDLFRVSGPMTVAGFMNQLNSWSSTLMVGMFVSTGAVGIYNSAARTALLVNGFVVAFNAIFSPMISDLYRRGSMRDLDMLYKDVSRWLFSGCLVFFLGTLLLAPDVMSVFGPEFVSGWPVLVIIAGGYLFNASVGSTGRILAMTDRQWIVMYVSLVTVALNVALNFLLLPSFGIVGSATATAFAMVASNAATLAAVRRSLGLWPYTHLYLKPIAAGALAVLAAYIFRLALPLPLGIVAVFVVGGVYLAAFLAALLLLGLNSSDRQFLRSVRNTVLRKVGRKKGT